MSDDSLVRRSKARSVDKGYRQAVEVFLSRWGPVPVSDLDIERCVGIPVDGDAARVLESLGMVESNSFYQLANAMMIPFRDEGWKSEFLPRWGAEEVQHGLVLRRLALACRGERSSAYTDFGRIDQSSKRLSQRYSRWLTAAAARSGPPFELLYAVFGAFQEHSVIQAYTLLERRIAVQPISNILAEIVSQERRHYAVYGAMADKLIVEHPRYRKVVERLLRWLWKPVGFEAMGPNRWDDVLAYICPSTAEETYLRRTDNVMSKRFGMSLTLMENAIASSRARAQEKAPIKNDLLGGAI